MSEFDDKVRRALERDVATGDEFKLMEPGVFDLMIDTFRGRQRWLAMISMVAGIVWMVAGIFAVVKFFQAESIEMMLRWMLGVIFCVLAVTMMKLWYWMQLDKHYLTREIKRLELQVARLSEQQAGRAANE